jgi:hypothetical protein
MEIFKIIFSILNAKPQINADERRFVNLNIQRLSEVYSVNCMIESPQRAQSSVFTMYKKAATSRLRTRMTRIARIFTDPCASASSAQSVFYWTPSAFICVHLRLKKLIYRQLAIHNINGGLL